MQVIFHLVFLVKTWFGGGCFRPKVGDVVGTTRLERYQMVNFELSRIMLPYSILSKGLVFLAVWDVAFPSCLYLCANSPTLNRSPLSTSPHSAAICPTI